MVRVAFLLATLLAVASAVDTVPVREGGMLRGPVDDTKGRRQLWGGWYTLMNHLCPPHAKHGPCKRHNTHYSYDSSSSSSSQSSTSENGSSEGGDTSEQSYYVDEDGNVVEDESVEENRGSGGGSSATASSSSFNWMVAAGGAVVAMFLVGAVLYKKKRDEKDDENGHFHNLAGSVKRIFDGNSTIATDDHTSASPDFVSLDGSAQTGGPPSNEIEMEYQGPSSDYAV